MADSMTAECATADASEMLEAVLRRLKTGDCRTIPVTEHGALIGLVILDNAGEFLMVQAAEHQVPGPAARPGLTRPPDGVASPADR